MISRSIIILGACIGIGCIAQPDSLHAGSWTCDFEGLRPGSLVGQDGWSDYHPGPGVKAVSPLIGYVDGEEARGLVVEQPLVEGEYVSRAKKSIRSKWGDGDSLILEFTARAGDSSGVATFGLGTQGDYPATFGIYFGRFALRQITYGGEIYFAVDRRGKHLSAIPGDWYCIRSIWTKSKTDGNWKGSLLVRNLSDGERQYTKLYFDRAQTVDEVSLGYSPNLTGERLDLVTVRTSQDGDALDDLLIQVSQ